MRIPALLTGVLLASTIALFAGCPSPPHTAGEGEGEGVAGEGEGEGVAGEGEGAPGEGEGGVGEGEGEGEGGAGEGEGAAGEGEGEGTPPQTCTQNRDCPLGEICPGAPNGTCVVGCTEAGDCHPGLQCDVAQGANGTCVACLIDNDCTGQGETCVNDQCVVACQGNGDCANVPGAPICDTAGSHTCVQCLQGRDCNLGEICTQNTCVAGCLSSSDCDQANGDVCDLSSGSPGQCVPGCTTDANCDLGTHCDQNAGVCVLGCNNDDTRCPQQDTCVNNRCQPAPIACNNAQNNNCNRGDHCDVANGVCAPGCAVDQDCGGGVNNVCNAATGDCVQCLQDQDCPQGGNFQSTCDLTLDECRAICDPTQFNGACFGTGGFNQGVCKPTDPNDPTAGLCVDCIADTDCNQQAGETCDQTTNTCAAPATQTGGLCSQCTSDADCGGTNQCIRHQENQNGAREDVCAQDCSTNGQCPQGFSCQFVSDVDTPQQQVVVTGKQCVPDDSAVTDGFPTCDAFRDAEAQAQCNVNFGAFCGFDQNGAGDGVCLPDDAQSNTGVCTLPCNVEADCPSGFVCDPVNLPNFNGTDSGAACIKQ